MNASNHSDLKFQVAYKCVTDLKPAAANARTHSSRQIEQIANSIAEFGFITPVVVDAGGVIVIGHARVEAAARLQLAQVPTLCVDHLTPDQCRLLAIADNKLAEIAQWDEAVLKIEFAELSGTGLDLTITGFETGEIDLILETPDLNMDECDPADIDVAPSKHAPVTKAGDVWILGGHRLVCGDVLVAETLKALMGDELASMTFNDPPYNVPIDGHVTVANKAQHDEFAMGVGEMSKEEFTLFLMNALNTMSHFSVDGSLHYACIDWRHHREMGEAGGMVFSELKNICVWDKGMGGMGSLYRSQHEFIFVFKKSTAPHINNIQLGKFGRNRTNVWSYPGVNALGGVERQETLAMHPTVKPTAMIADAILDCTNRGDIVLDGFAGSGTTVIAAERTQRRARCVEIDPAYVDVAIERWQRVTGSEGVLEGVGKTFAEVATDRGVNLDASASVVELEEEVAHDLVL